MITLEALIVIDVHAKEVVETLERGNIVDVGAFEWISQLRYYWVKPQGNSAASYGND
jgi:dynein heavy chain, axonemal